MAVVFTDSFSGVLGSALDGRVGTGGTWSCSGNLAADIAGWKIDAGNKAKLATSNGCLARIDSGASDHYAKAAISTTTTAVAAAARAIDWQNFIGLRASGATTIELFKRIGGVETSIVKVTVATLVTPFTAELRIAGTTAYLFLNGAQIGLSGGYQVADALFAGVTRVGLWGKSSSLDPAATTFEAGTLAAAVAVAGGRASMRDRSAGVALALSIAPVAARAPARAAAARLVADARLNVTGGRGAQRVGMAMLTATAPMLPASARLAMRGGTAALTASARMVADAARVPTRAGAVALTIFEVGVATPVVAETRTVAVAGDRPTMVI